VAIVGLGLIGGSIGLALKQHRPDIEVLGVARREATAAKALELGAADRAAIDIELVAEADLVILACPLGETRALLGRVAPLLAPGARVTDVGSVKGEVVKAAADVLRADTDGRRGNPFLGGHPMAGKEVSGIEHADAALFTGRPWVFTPPGSYEPGEWQDLVQLVRDIGALPVFLPPEKHDRYVALVSHVPFLLSAAFLLAVGGEADWSDAAALASSGFRDISRLGAGDSDMYAAIASSNREQILAAWRSLHAALDQLEGAIVNGDDAALLDLLAGAREVRDAWAREHPQLS
jgi:prephenate dehydrogenase